MDLDDFKKEGLFSPQVEPDDALTRARHVWKKGRLEFMGGPVFFTQGHGVPGYENNARHCTYEGPMAVNRDPVAHDLGTDVTEQ